MRKQVIRYFDRNSRRRFFARSLRVEQLESRVLMNVDWRNPVDSFDVNNDSTISPLDVLVVINDLNARGARALPPTRNPAEPFLDVTGNQSVDPLDVLTIINYLNVAGSGARLLKEQGQYSVQQEINITLGQASGARLYRMEVNPDFGAASGTGLVPDLFSVYLVDPANPSHTLLDRGVNGTSLFSLSARGSELGLGLARWDGHILEIDLSSIKNQDTGLLRVQLLNGDPSSQSTVSIRPLENAIDSERVAGTLFSTSGTVQVPGPALNLASLTSASSVKVEVENVRFDPAQATFVAEVGIKNLGSAIGRDVALVLPGLPAGVALSNASGISTNGLPYLNLSEAIKAGGLGANSRSDRVELRISNPGRQLFTLQPQIQVGVTNRAPALAPIPTQTVTPGGILTIQFAATDADNDQVTYMVRQSSGNGQLPTGLLQASNGSIVFAPTPSELGTYQLEVSASDGALTTIQRFTLNVVADPVTTTRISGRVLDIDEKPIVGITVQIGAVQGLTQSDGTFMLDLGSGQVVSDTIKIHGELFAGARVYPFIAEKFAFLLEHNVFIGWNNVIARSIYLPPLDVANGKRIDPLKATTVTTAAIPGVSLFVAAGTLMNQQGTPFTGVLSITKVPVNLTPAALPKGLNPDMVVTIQPGEMVFATPARMTFPNSAGWAPGTKMDLWSINPVTGEFSDVGDMRVSANGSQIDTISGGVRNSSWHFPAPLPITPKPPAADPRNPDTGCYECSAQGDFNSQVELHSGAVLDTHNLVSYQSLGVERSVTLQYDSLRADPRPIVHFGYNNANGDSQQRMMARLSVRGANDFTYAVPGAMTSDGSLPTGANFWKLPTTASTVDAALQADLRSAPSGVYTYALDSGIVRLNDGRVVGSTSNQEGRLIHVNTIDSPLGSGWSIAGVQELIENSDGSVLLVDGDGSELLFGAPLTQNTKYQSPPGDFSTLSKAADGSFTRVMKDQTVFSFTPDHKLNSVRDRNGNQTTYLYTNGLLTKIFDPVGLETVFGYSAGRVTSITDPVGRTTTLAYDDAGNLATITDPDGAVQHWTYDGEHHVTSKTDQRGFREETFYDFAGLATRAVRKDGSKIVVQPVQVQGLTDADKTIDPATAPLALNLGEPIARINDASGNVQQSNLDRAGQAVERLDGAGSRGSTNRNSLNQVDKRVDGNGNATYFDYDDRGNLIRRRDSILATRLLVLGSGVKNTDDAVANSLRANGIVVTVGPEPRIWNGTQADLHQFDAVLTLRSNVFGPGMPQAGQEALVAFVQQGGGLITTEWLIYNGGLFPQLSPILPATAIGYSDARPTTFARATPDEYLDAGLGSSFVITQGYSNGTEGLLEAKTGAQVFYTSTNAQHPYATAGVVGWDVDAGRVLSWSIIMTATEPADAEAAQLLANSVHWVTRSFGSELFTYDATFNVLTSATDGLGRQTLYDIDPVSGNLRKATRVVGAVGGADDIVTLYTYTQQGLVDTMSDPLGRVTDYDYDARGLLNQVTYAKGTTDQAIEQYEHDLNTAAGRAGLVTAYVDGNAHRTTNEYDTHNRRVKMTEPDPDGAGPLLSPVTRWEYDTFGNVVKLTDARGNVTMMEYDSLNRMVKTISPDPDGSGPLAAPITRQSYDPAGNLSSEMDSNGFVTKHGYDARNRLIATTDPSGGITKYGYDANDNRTLIADPLGNRTRFTYDARNRLTSETSEDATPSPTTSRFEYDSVDNRTSMTDRSGLRTEYAYDELNRVTNEKWIGGGNEFVYAYDQASNLLSATDQFSTLVMTYDARDRTNRVDNQGTPGVPHVALGYAYDAVGNVRTVSETINGAAGATTGYIYDGLDRQSRLTQMGASTSPRRVDLTYNALGQFATIDRFADLSASLLVVASQYTYDNMNRLSRLAHNKSSSTVAFYDFAYDAANRITRLTDVDGATDYAYDNRDQLTGANHAATSNPDELYSYDANGNRVTSQRHGSSYVTGTENRLLSDGIFNYVYDAQGNMLRRTEIASGKSREFQWDFRIRLTAIIDRDATNTATHREEFSYDAFDRRISKNSRVSANSVTTYFVYDRDDVLLDFVDNDVPTGPIVPSLDMRYLHGPSVDQVLAQDDGVGGVLWLLADQLGTVRDLVDNTGNLQNHITFDGFGNVVSQSHPASMSRYQFTGREFDSDSKLSFYRARYYYPSIGRFLTSDPLGVREQDTNAYAYVRNRTTNRTDPFGLKDIGFENPGRMPNFLRGTGQTLYHPSGWDGIGVHVLSKIIVATLYSSEGVVEKQGPDGVWVQATIGTVFFVTDKVRTASCSRAGIRFTDGILVRMNANSLLEFKKEGAQQLQSGSGYFFSREPKGFPTIKTPTVSLGVRG